MSPDQPQQLVSGLVVVDKPAGLTSHDVVAEVRRLAETRKVGHAGTLDPMATGVLVLGVNRATRLLGHLLITDKTYDATLRLGAATTTDDAEGEVLTRNGADDLSEETVLTALSGLVGEVEQVPSAVSAIKVDGRRAYERVRAGEQVELAPRRVRIDSIEVRSFKVVQDDDPAATGPRSFIDLEVSIRCSSGTYIRAIARDLGEHLGTGGHLTSLRRTSVGPFGLEVARTLEQLRGESDNGVGIVPIEVAARSVFASYELDEAGVADVRHGRKLAVDLGVDGPVAMFAPDGEFLALYEQVSPVVEPGAELWARAVAVFV